MQFYIIVEDLKRPISYDYYFPNVVHTSFSALSQISKSLPFGSPLQKTYPYPSGINSVFFLLQRGALLHYFSRDVNSRRAYGT